MSDSNEGSDPQAQCEASSSKAVGMIGLGAMGGFMAARLLANGYVVHVHDVNEATLADVVALGAVRADGPTAIADAAEIVLVSLPTPDVFQKVATGPGGIIEGRSVRILVDLSTTGPTVARDVAKALASRNIACLDAPVSGGPAGAKAGTLAVMVSGDRAAFDRVEAVLQIIGRNLTYVGSEVGQAQTLKLANNLLAATTYIAAVEAFAMGVKAGLSPALMVDVVNNSSGRSVATERLIPEAVLTRAFSYGFRLELMAKDVRLSLDEAARLGVNMPVSGATRALWAESVARGDGPRDFTYVARLLEEQAGVEITEKAGERRDER